MNKQEARQLLGEELKAYQEKTYAELISLSIDDGGWRAFLPLTESILKELEE
jgi:hypothetical protein